MKPGDLVRLSDLWCQNDPCVVLMSESILSGVPTGEWSQRDTGIILEIMREEQWHTYRVLVGSATGWIYYRDVVLVGG